MTHGPTTLMETLTCTKWTGPLGLKQRRHRVNFCQLQKAPPLASEELPTSQERKLQMLPLQSALRPGQRTPAGPAHHSDEGHS